MSTVSRYQKRISGPLPDRINLHVDAPRVDYEKLSSDQPGEPTAAVRVRVEAARERQRFAGVEDYWGIPLVCNADMGPAEIRQFCIVGEAGESLLKAATPALGPQVQVCSTCTSARGHITASLSWRALLPIWPAASTSRRRTSPRRFNTGRGEWCSDG